MKVRCYVARSEKMKKLGKDGVGKVKYRSLHLFIPDGGLHTNTVTGTGDL